MSEKICKVFVQWDPSLRHDGAEQGCCDHCGRDRCFNFGARMRRKAPEEEEEEEEEEGDILSQSFLGIGDDDLQGGVRGPNILQRLRYLQDSGILPGGTAL